MAGDTPPARVAAILAATPELGDPHPTVYEPLTQAERELVARRCLEGVHSWRVTYAEQIRRGDLYDPKTGLPKYYWHCLATKPPPAPEGRMGQWKATAEKPAEWRWQDWGPIASFRWRR